MTEKGVDWKHVGELYTMEGTFLEVGTFTDENGNELPINEKDIQGIIDGIERPIPMAIGHGSTEDIGYTTQLANYGNSKGLFKGYSNDPSAMQNAILQGYSSVSPEIEVTYDSFGNPIKKELKRICFVKNPAIPGAKAKVNRFAFSAPEVTIMTPPQQQQGQLLNTSTPQQMQNPMAGWSNNAPLNQPAPAQYQTSFTDNTNYNPSFWQYVPQTGTVPMPQTLQQNTAPAQQPNNQLTEMLEAMKASNDTIAALKAEIEALKGQKTPETSTEQPKTDAKSEEKPAETQPTNISKELMDEYAKATKELNKLKSEKEDAMKTTCSNIINDLKKLDVKQADKMFSNLDLASRIEALNQFKERIVAQTVATTPMNSPPHAPITAEGGSSQATPDSSISGVIGSLQLDNSPEYRDPEFLKQLHSRIARKHKNIQI